MPVLMSSISPVALTGVVYSAGKVFNGLSTGRLDTENFLRSGSTEGIASRADLALLEDLRDASRYIIDNSNLRGAIDARFVCGVNSTICRSGALRPGQLRTSAQHIGVDTRYGRHAPDAMTMEGLQILVDTSLTGRNVFESSINLFVSLARAQPFEDGNKRTALFAANGLLLVSGAGYLLTIPVSRADEFNDLLARAYVFGDLSGVSSLLADDGLVPPD
jgi:hypothetical protein